MVSDCLLSWSSNSHKLSPVTVPTVREYYSVTVSPFTWLCWPHPLSFIEPAIILLNFSFFSIVLFQSLSFLSRHHLISSSSLVCCKAVIYQLSLPQSLVSFKNTLTYTIEKYLRRHSTHGSTSVPCSAITREAPSYSRWPDTMQRVRHLGTLSPKQGVSIKLFPKRAHGTPWKRRQKECKRSEGMKNTKKTRLSKPISSTHI